MQKHCTQTIYEYDDNLAVTKHRFSHNEIF